MAENDENVVLETAWPALCDLSNVGVEGMLVV